MRSFEEIDPAYSRIKIVGSIREVLRDRFTPKVSANCCKQVLTGDFNAFALYMKQMLQHDGKIKKVHDHSQLDANMLERYLNEIPPSLKDCGQQVREDFMEVSAGGQIPKLRIITGVGYNKNTAPGGLHHDTFRNANRGRALRNYTPAETRGACPGDVIQISNSTYELKPGRELFGMGIGNFWNFACSGNEEGAHPYVHIPGYPENDDPNAVRALLVGN